MFDKQHHLQFIIKAIRIKSWKKGSQRQLVQGKLQVSPSTKGLRVVTYLYSLKSRKTFALSFNMCLVSKKTHTTR